MPDHPERRQPEGSVTARRARSPTRRDASHNHRQDGAIGARRFPTGAHDCPPPDGLMAHTLYAHGMVKKLEPLLDEEVRVHLGRDEIHPGDDAALRGGCRDFIERSLIGVTRVVELAPSSIERSDGPISRTSTPGTEAMASRFSSDWLVSIIGTMTSSLFTVSR